MPQILPQYPSLVNVIDWFPEVFLSQTPPLIHGSWLWALFWGEFLPFSCSAFIPCALDLWCSVQVSSDHLIHTVLC